jgi:hypothetical protein
VTPIPCAHGTATVDGVKSPGEWSTAAPCAVFQTGTFSGSQLYVMHNDVNTCLGLFIRDSVLAATDVFWTRRDSKHDGITMVGDDEVSGTIVR